MDFIDYEFDEETEELVLWNLSFGISIEETLKSININLKN
tara:strand:- start:470 stop:589 length:120 start_codon:yes stop_codon:yes gene_type:complete